MIAPSLRGTADLVKAILLHCAIVRGPLTWGMTATAHAIVLVGFSGSGKSSVGRELAVRTGLPRYDTDEIVRAKFGLPIVEIFSQHGEEAFREAETSALREIPRERAVVVTGGGIVLRDENVAMLRALGTIVHLSADEETLFERISRRSTRPLLRSPNPRETLAELLRVREPLYRSVAAVTIDTSARTHEEVSKAILEQVAAIDERIETTTR
ncbi:MAG: shikimate kinase [Chthoniobacterales bacterium]